jgi:hypothetical protein
MATAERQVKSCGEEIDKLENPELKAFLSEALKSAGQNKLDLAKFIETLSQKQWD